MEPLMKQLFSTGLLALAAAWSLPAAAETTECTNITSLPAVISNSGVYCMKQDLATAMTSGYAITINAHNVVLDCNGYRLGGLSAGVGTQTTGIHAATRKNITVRDCNVRGFRRGLEFTYYGDGGNGGHVVEDSLFESNTQMGIMLSGDRSIARRNRVLNTGGSTLPGEVVGLWVTGRPAFAEHNFVSGIVGGADGAESAGLKVTGYMSLARDNVITDIKPGNGISSGIHGGGTSITLEHNFVDSVLTYPHYGINTTYGSVLCLDNRVRAWTTSAYDGCNEGGGNYPDIP
jgi:hypothetical protein